MFMLNVMPQARLQTYKISNTYQLWKEARSDEISGKEGRSDEIRSPRTGQNSTGKGRYGLRPTGKAVNRGVQERGSGNT